jgi:hypothetical protein
VSATEEIVTSALSIGAGVAAAAGGIALTVMTGGLFAIVSGAALVGAGSSLVMNPIQKQITGECMTLSDTAQDIALGATIGIYIIIIKKHLFFQCNVFRCNYWTNWSWRIRFCKRCLGICEAWS